MNAARSPHLRSDRVSCRLTRTDLGTGETWKEFQREVQIFDGPRKAPLMIGFADIFSEKFGAGTALHIGIERDIGAGAAHSWRVIDALQELLQSKRALA